MRYVLWSFLPIVALLAFEPVAASETGHDHEHLHDNLEISSLPNKPAVSLEITQDAVSGWNIRLETTNFRFAPEKVNKAPVPGEGHAHLYVDGHKVARLYSPWFHLDHLSPGRHAIRVTLNANNHANFVIYGKAIDAVEEIEQQ